MQPSIKWAVTAVLSLMQILQTQAEPGDKELDRAMLCGAMTKIQLHIADDAGAPVLGASVRVLMGMNFTNYWIEGESDKDGLFQIEGKTCGNEIVIFVEKDGYYKSKKNLSYIASGTVSGVKDGKWQPYGMDLQMELRKIRNASKMPHQSGWNFKYTGNLRSWIGFDIERNDFVAPHGTGSIADFEVYIDWDGGWMKNFNAISVKIRFVERFSGYYEYIKSMESEFKGPYRAEPGLIAKRDAEFYEFKFDDGRWKQKDFDHKRCWVVRSRCKQDSSGALLSANYSVVDSVAFCCEKDGIAGFCIESVFNPRPNDTNLEFDPKQNLYKGVKGGGMIP